MALQRRVVEAIEGLVPKKAAARLVPLLEKMAVEGGLVEDESGAWRGVAAKSIWADGRLDARIRALLAEGKSVPEIAAVMVLPRHKVRNRVYRHHRDLALGEDGGRSGGAVPQEAEAAPASLS